MLIDEKENIIIVENNITTVLSKEKQFAPNDFFVTLTKLGAGKKFTNSDISESTRNVFKNLNKRYKEEHGV